MDTAKKYRCMSCNVIFNRTDKEYAHIHRTESIVQCHFCDTCRKSDSDKHISPIDKLKSLEKRVEILEERMKTLFPEEME